jgi:dephospho-CoA kinase
MPGVGKSVASKLLSSFKIKVIVAGVATEESGIALEEFVKDVI